MLNYTREDDTITVTKLCRLARNTKHLLEIMEFLDGKGVSLLVLNLGIDTKSPTGRLMLTMIGAVASFERELLLERQTEGIAIAKAKGKYKGRKPTATAKSNNVIQFVHNRVSKRLIAERRGLSLASVYHIIRSR